MTNTQRRGHPQRWWVGLAVVVALSLVGAACGDDDDDDAAATDDTTADAADTTEAATGGGGGGDNAAFCQARVDLEAQFASQEPDPAAVTAVLEDFEAAAPAELVENVTGLGEALAGAAEAGGDPTQDPAFAANIDPIDQYVAAECGFDTVEIAASEYAFDGIPAEIPAGLVAISLTNEGSEPHEVVLFKRVDGEERPVEELLALPEEEMSSAVTFAGAAMAEPGKTSLTLPTLEPGSYIAVCFLPTGGVEGSPPHFMEGMTAELEVV